MLKTNFINKFRYLWLPETDNEPLGISKPKKEGYIELDEEVKEYKDFYE